MHEENCVMTMGEVLNYYMSLREGKVETAIQILM